MKQAEILAPCGGEESVRAAVSCGADAVYLGRQAFNARQNAANFSDQSLRETVGYCHLYGVKVYQTLNTLVFDSELAALEECVKTGCEAGIDAFIVQDLGALKLISALAPGMRLHASTQMTIHTPAGAQFLERLGVKRAVLARELSLEEIQEIRAASGIELEVFVHGALCVCVSGQCYMSGMLGGRSGNRGRCAQPCRLPFSVHGDGAADLSLKDLCAIPRLQELAEAGVDSFKIEGRMKRPEYVAAAVTACVKQRAGETPDLDTLRAVFSRSGFTDGYLTGKRDGEMFGTREKEDVLAAAQVLAPLHELYRRPTQRVGCVVKFTAHPGERVHLEMADPAGNHAAACGMVPEPARERPVTVESAREALSRLGGTPFYIQEFRAELGEGLMVPAKELNALRRSCVEQLTQLRSSPRPIPFERRDISLPKPIPKRKQVLYLRAEKPEQLQNMKFNSSDCILLPLRYWDKLEHFNREQVMLELPRTMFGREKKIAETLALAKEAGFSKMMLHNPAQIPLGKRLGFEMAGGFGLNVTNSLAAAFYLEQGLQELTISFEACLEQTRRMRHVLPMGLVAYGHLPLMITRICPLQRHKKCAGRPGEGRLTDRQSKKFSIICHDGAREIYNPDVLYLADKMRDISPFDFAILYFTYETAEEAAKVVEEYRQGAGHRERLTRGLYYRKI